MDDDRFRKLALSVLVLNVTIILLGFLGYAWNARREASRPLAPTNRAELVLDNYGVERG